MRRAEVLERFRAAWRALRNPTSSAAGTSRRSQFKGAEVTRLLADWVAPLLHPDDELRWDLRRLRARGRELRRNNPLARGFLRMLSTNVIGPTGFKHQAQVRDNSGKLSRGINTKIEAAWTDWSRRPTADGKLTLTQLSHQLLQGVASEGEQFVRMRFGFKKNPYRFALEVLDPDQLDELFNRVRADDGNEVRMGVEVDEDNAPVGYHFYDKAESFFGAATRERKRVRRPASEIIHLFDVERAGQTRGAPWIVAAMHKLKMTEGYSEAELVAARTAAAKMGWFTKKTGEDATGEIAANPDTNTVTLDASPGTFDFAPDGYTLEMFDPNHPAGAFAEFMKSQIREIATAIGVSYNALANDLENVNYSSMRSGLLIERDVWRMNQEWWDGVFLRRIRSEWLNMALLSGALSLDSRAPQKFEPCKFTGRGWPWVDPLKDGQAGELGIRNGFTSRRRLLSEQGLDFEQVLEELAEEQDMAAEYGVDISGTKAATPATPPQDDDSDDDSDDDDKAGANGNGNGKGKQGAGRLAAALAGRSRHA